jgi:hypothetical protein
MKKMIVFVLALTAFSAFAQSEVQETKCMQIGLYVDQVCSPEKTIENQVTASYQATFEKEGRPVNYSEFSAKLKKQHNELLKKQTIRAVCLVKFEKSCVLELDKPLE